MSYLNVMSYLKGRLYSFRVCLFFHSNELHLVELARPGRSLRVLGLSCSAVIVELGGILSRNTNEIFWRSKAIGREKHLYKQEAGPMVEQKTLGTVRARIQL